MKVKLTAVCYQVAQASTGAEGLAAARHARPDLILCASHLPDMTPGAFAQTLRLSPQTRSVPLVVETVARDGDFRYDILAAGADDILLKPYDDRLLLARLRSLLRLRETEEELTLREGAHHALGLSEEPEIFARPGRVALVAPTAGAAVKWRTRLEHHLAGDINACPLAEAMRCIAANTAPDVVALVLTDATAEAGLQLLADLRAQPRTRDAGILALVEGKSAQRLAADALDRGASDVITDSISAREIALRLSRQITRKHTIDRLRADMRDGLRAALTDPLTGLFNRRHALPHMAKIAEAAKRRGGDFAAMIIDVDHFKAVNDRFGHAAGDAALTQLAKVLRNATNDDDLVARIGGEEFLVVLPNTSRTAAQMAAKRICNTVRETPFPVPGRARPLQITVSIGVACLSDVLATQAGHIADENRDRDLDMAAECQDPGPARAGPDADTQEKEPPPPLHQAVLRQADKALYGAKTHGRNQVTLCRARSAA